VRLPTDKIPRLHQIAEMEKNSVFFHFFSGSIWLAEITVNTDSLKSLGHHRHSLLFPNKLQNAAIVLSK
jgi:hypothetical protein